MSLRSVRQQPNLETDFIIPACCWRAQGLAAKQREDALRAVQEEAAKTGKVKEAALARLRAVEKERQDAEAANDDLRLGAGRTCASACAVTCHLACNARAAVMSDKQTQQCPALKLLNLQTVVTSSVQASVSPLRQSERVPVACWAAGGLVLQVQDKVC
jgi:hypothetical protein